MLSFDISHRVAHNFYLIMSKRVFWKFVFCLFHYLYESRLIYQQFLGLLSCPCIPFILWWLDGLLFFLVAIIPFVFSDQGQFPHLSSCFLSDCFLDRLPVDLQNPAVGATKVTLSLTIRIKTTKSNCHRMPFWSLHFFPHINKNSKKKSDTIFFKKLHHSLNHPT